MTEISRYTAALLLGVFVGMITSSAVLAQWPPANYVRPAVRGTVTDSATGRPVARARFILRSRPGLGITDSSGHYLAPGARVGRAELVVFCPTSRALRGKRVLSRWVDVGPKTDTVVDLTMDMSRCVDVPESHRRVELTGYYRSGFESSDFRPCVPVADAPNSAYDNDWIWVSFADSVRYAAGVRWPERKRNEDYPVAFVTFAGDLVGPGMYGHLGGAGYQLTVTDVLEARRPRKSDCRLAEPFE